MQQRLPLAGPAEEVAAHAVFPDLREVACHRAPAFDLARVVGTAPADVVTAVPLEPAARILVVDPAFLPPFRKRLRRVDAEAIERAVVALGAELRVLEPVVRKLRGAVGHVLAAEYAEPEHLFRRELRLEVGMKI